MTRSSDAFESGSAPFSVTSEVRPCVIAMPASASKMMMWMKNTMPGAAGVTQANWFGITYRDDKPRVVEAIRQLVSAGEYPAKIELPLPS